MNCWRICNFSSTTFDSISPNPSVSFSKDDSGGSFGNKKAQVNINNPGDTYTLTATATNSEGSASDTITIDWGCPIPTPDPIETNIDIGADIVLSGYIIVDLGVYPGPVQAFVGDADNNKLIKSYFTFDISSISVLDDVTIKEVSVTIPIVGGSQFPELASSTINIKVFDYGTSLDYPADQVVGGVTVKTLSTSHSLTNMDFTSNKLKDELQKAVDINKQLFQLKIGLGGVSADSIYDFYSMFIADVVLHIKYEVPG